MQFWRKAFPYLMALMAVAAVAWAVSFGTLPPADFAWQNGDEIKTVDPARATGAPEGRILDAVFEGLLRNAPAGPRQANGIQPMAPKPGVAAAMPEISDDGRVYTFQLRDDARWTNGDPVTADDFFWSWRRMLHPETASEYAYQLYYIVGAEQYNTAQVTEGDKVEVELPDRPDPLQAFPRGTIRRGILRRIVPAESASQDTDDADAAAEEDARRQAYYVVEVKPEVDGQVDWEATGETQVFSIEPASTTFRDEETQHDVQTCLHVLIDFEAAGGVRVLGPKQLQITLKNRTAYFNSLLAFYPLYPVNRQCVEQYGSPYWTKPDHIVSNGPYRIQFRRIRDRVRLIKNETYWDADNVHLETLDAMAVKSQTTALNMYLKGQLDWATDVPQTMIPELKKRDDFLVAPALITYFYRLNVDRPPLDNVLVRRALNMAMDKQALCDYVAKAGQQPARGLVPPGMAGYEGALAGEFNVTRARELLAEAGYPGGRGLPRIEILYNTSEGHQAIAEAIQQQWKNNLGIDVELRNMEWGVYLDTVSKTNFTVARAGWIGDYPDPNTFLDMFVTGGPQNNTNWSNAQYDRLIEQAASEPDAEQRMQLLREAETILMDELPIIPIYFYVSINMVHPEVQGFAPTLQDVHPLMNLRIDRPSL